MKQLSRPLEKRLFTKERLFEKEVYYGYDYEFGGMFNNKITDEFAKFDWSKIKLPAFKSKPTMKLSAPLMAALRTTLVQNTLASVGIKWQPPYGLTEEEWAVARDIKDTNRDHAATYILTKSRQVPPPKYQSLRDQLYSGTSTKGKLDMLSLSVLVVEGTEVSGSSSVIHGTRIVLHGLHGHLLMESGSHDDMYVVRDDDIRLATEEEIDRMIEEFSDAQLKAVITRAEFQPVRDMVLLETLKAA